MAHSDNPNDPDIIIDLWNNMMSGQAAFRREQLECRFGQQSQLPIMKSATRTGTRVPRRSRRIHHCLRVPPTSALYFSFLRTDVRSRITEPTDWQNDKKANTCGQQGGNCDQTCAPFVPKHSPGKPQFHW